jgi:WD40 repeat protein/serine/threonine protein kinase
MERSVERGDREREQEPLPPLISAALEEPAPSLVERLHRIAGHSPPTTRYTPLGEVGRGGMGRVLRVWDEDLQREVAMKIVTWPDRTGATSQAGSAERSEEERAAHERLITRFLEEARVTAQLHHPGIVPVYEIAVDPKGSLYFTMPLVRGQDLARVFALARAVAEGWNAQRAVAVLHRVCLTVAYAHARGVIHRDLKPANVMVGPYGEAYVMDWGLSLLLGRSDAGGIVGTPAYMPPEQARGLADEIGPRSDVYALGAMLYELLSGRMPREVPLSRERTSALVENPLDRDPTPIESLAPEAPAELVAICRKAMRREPSARYTTALELADDLRAWLEGRVVTALPSGRWDRFRKWRARNPSLALAVDALVLLAVGSFGLLTFQQSRTIQARERSLRQAERSAYASNLRAAELSLRMRETKEAKRRLADCPADLRGWEWRYLTLRSDTSLAVGHGHDGAVNAVAAAPDGSRVASAGDDGVIRLWQAASLQPITSMVGHEGAVRALAWSADGAWIASGGADRAVRIWRAEESRLDRILAPQGDEITGVAFADDARWLAAVDSKASALVWDLDHGIAVREIDLGGERGSSLFFLEGHRRLFALDTAGGASVWELETGLCTARWQGGETSTSMAIDRQGSRAAVAFATGEVVVLDAADLHLLTTFQVGDRGSSALAWSPEGRRLAVGSYNGSLRTWSLDSSTFEHEVFGHEHEVKSIAWLTASRLATGSSDDSVRLWSLEALDQLALRGHTDTVDVLAFSPDGTRLASGGRDQTVRIWRGDSGEPLACFRSDEMAGALAWSPNGERLAWAAGGDRVVIADAASGAPVADLEAGTRWVRALAFLDSGERLLSQGGDEIAHIWDVARGAELVRTSGSTGASGALAVAPDGQTFATGGEEGQVRIWRSADGQLVRTLDAAGASIVALAYAHEAPWLAAATDFRSILVWDLSTEDPARVLAGHDGQATSVAFSLDDERLASGSLDRTVRIWDPRRGDALLTLRGHREAVTAVAFGGERGDVLASASIDHQIRLWSIARPSGERR